MGAVKGLTKAQTTWIWYYYGLAALHLAVAIVVFAALGSSRWVALAWVVVAAVWVTLARVNTYSYRLRNASEAKLQALWDDLERQIRQEEGR